MKFKSEYERKRNNMMRRNAVVSHKSSVHNESKEKKSLEPFSRRGGVVLSGTSIKNLFEEEEFGEEIKDKNEQNSASSTYETLLVKEDKTEHNLKPTKKKKEIPTLSKHPNNISSLSDTHIIIDKELGFNINHEGNALFLAIIDAYYTDIYAEAVSGVHRGIILNTAVDDIYSRAFKFVWRSKGKYSMLKDDDIILKKIKLLFKEIIEIL